MTDRERDQHFERLQLDAKRLGVTVVEMLLTGSELFWRIKLNQPNVGVAMSVDWVWRGKE